MEVKYGEFLKKYHASLQGKMKQAQNCLVSL